MNTNQHKGDVTNFWELLSNHKIEIPIIQRDYAQGRKDKEEIRSNFLNALFESISEHHPIKLDFIYGNLEAGISHPLDGQQRLTTLFLLHWYAAVKEQTLNKDNIEILKKFTYETRISSREFCHSLVSNKINFQDGSNPSEYIIDSSWFFLSWKKDPTIDSMLRTIDSIHEIFHDVDDLWERLTGDENLISFYHIELEGIGLTDDLYIKMNARGKLLSSFENFKASFQKHINDNVWEGDVDFVDSFALKIDTSWTDLFWNGDDHRNVDSAFIRFIATIIMCRKSVSKADNRMSEITKLQDNPNLVKPSMFDLESFEYLCNAFNKYYELKKENVNLSLEFPLFQHKPDGDIFTAICFEANNASYTQKALFFAQTEFLLKSKDLNLDAFYEWMRVIRNIVSRGDVVKTGVRPAIIRSPQTFDGVINLISELSEGCDDIYGYLRNNRVKSYFAKEQVEEEILKSKIINLDENNKSVLFSVEDTNLLQGKIDFALNCIDFDKNNLSSFSIDDLKMVYKVIVENFNHDSDVSNLMRRALLTIPNEYGKFSYYEYWWSFWNVVSANKRCLIDGTLRALEFYIYGNNGEYSIYLKNLISRLKCDDLQGIIDKFEAPEDMPNWKVRLIKEPNLLDDNCKSNHLAIPSDESSCFLLKSMRPRDIDGCFEVK
ncbi:GmrSD restriction endonuclease domain-containing protein [Vibrio parahaemolyticus]|uniref:GmrSD restriction endonuclease domain-containing protein n=1 Tax=Vibrio parahaemolyticus TaxID=670 RepID=UPI001E5C432F|nr:DUF262 domain-containing protein [Vibrio parahaemolyticus]